MEKTYKEWLKQETARLTGIQEAQKTEEYEIAVGDIKNKLIRIKDLMGGQDAVAKLHGVSHQYIQKIERDPAAIRFDGIIRYALTIGAKIVIDHPYAECPEIKQESSCRITLAEARSQLGLSKSFMEMLIKEHGLMPLNGDGKLIVIDTQGLTDAIESYHIGRLKDLKKTRLSAPIVSYPEAANTLGISENALRQRVKVGKIAFIRKGRKRYISLAELERHLVNPDTHLTPAGK